MPTSIFVSYARDDDESGLVRRFVDDLWGAIVARKAKRLGRAPKQSDHMFFDSRSILTGTDWSNRIAAAVTTSPACVAICSRNFRASEFCGKEVGVFLDRFRRAERNARAARGGQAGGGPFVPVRWTSDEVPQAFNRFQTGEEALGTAYLELGLRAMYELPKKFRTERAKAVQVLATRVMEAVNRALPPRRQAMPGFDLLLNAFDDKPRPAQPYGVACVPLVQGSLNADPYGRRVPLRGLLDKVIPPPTVWHPLVPTHDFKKGLDEARKTRQVVVVLTDDRTVADQAFGPVYGAVDAAAGPHMGFVMVWRRALTPQLREGSAITLRGMFPTAINSGWHFDHTSATSPRKLEAALGTAVMKLRQRLARGATRGAARDPRLARAARAAGVPAGPLPVLSGPGGQST